MQRFVVLGVGAFALGACSDDTGILVEVHGEDVQADIVRLDTMVIIDDGAAARPDGAAWGAAEMMSADVGIDLHVDAYTVMLRPDGVADDTAVWVSALAYDAQDRLVGWGQVDDMVAFKNDLVKRVELQLHDAQVVGDGCVVKNGNVVVRTSADCDADEVTFDVDCDDLDAQIGGDLDGDPVVCDGDCDQTDPAIYPGNREICDGFDDDCDPLTLPAPQLCVQVARDDGGNVIECAVGEQLCDDTHDPGQFGFCLAAPIDPTTNNGLCQYWADCLEAGGDVQSCIVDDRMHCAVGVADSGVACLAAITPSKLSEYFGFEDTTDCSWRLIGNVQQGAWNVGIRQHGSSGPIASFYGACDGELVVESSGTAPHVIVLEADLGLEIFDFAVVLDPRRTGCDPSTGSDLECSVDP
jgi:hypothetical protein